MAVEMATSQDIKRKRNLFDDDDNDDSDQEFVGEKLLLRYLKMKLSMADSVAGVRKEVAPNLWQAIRVILSLDGIQFMLPMDLCQEMFK